MNINIKTTDGVRTIGRNYISIIGALEQLFTDLPATGPIEIPLYVSSMTMDFIINYVNYPDRDFKADLDSLSPREVSQLINELDKIEAREPLNVIIRYVVGLLAFTTPREMGSFLNRKTA